MQEQKLWTPSTGFWEPAEQVAANISAITADSTLAIVDMQIHYFQYLTQEGFDATFAGVMRELDDAMSLGVPVVLVEYDGCGPSHPELYTRLAGYLGSEKPEPVLKTAWSGGKEIFDACDARGYSTKVVRVCGLYTHACIQATAETLAGYPDVKVEVVVDACCSWRSKYDWTAYKGLSNPRLVRQPRKRELLRAAA